MQALNEAKHQHCWRLKRSEEVCRMFSLLIDVTNRETQITKNEAFTLCLNKI